MLLDLAATPGTHGGDLQIDASFLCVCPVIGHKLRNHIVKVAVDPLLSTRR